MSARQGRQPAEQRGRSAFSSSRGRQELTIRSGLGAALSRSRSRRSELRRRSGESASRVLSSSRVPLSAKYNSNMEHQMPNFSNQRYFMNNLQPPPS